MKIYALLTDLFSPDEKAGSLLPVSHMYEGFTWVEFSSGAKLHVWTDVLISSESGFNSKTVSEPRQWWKSQILQDFLEIN